MIAIPRDVARAFRALAKKCLAGRPRGPAPPVVVRVRAGVLTIWSRIESVGLRYSVAAPAAENVTLLVAMDLLAAIEGARSDPVSLAVDAKLQGTASWAEGGEAKSHSFKAILPGKQHAVPTLPELVPMPDAFRTALHECGRTAAREANRFVLNQVQIRGASGHVIGTDSKFLLVWGGFVFPFPETVLVPAIPVFGCRELADEPDVRVGRTDTEVVVACGPWSVHLPIASGKFPDALSILPKPESCSSVTFDDAQAAELLLALPAMPGATSEDRPVTLDLNGSLTVRACDEASEVVQELNLAVAVEGPQLAAAVNRTAIERALRLGCRTLLIPSGVRLLALEGPDCIFAVAALDSSAIVPSANRTSSRPAVPSLRSGPMKPVNGTAANGRHPPTPSEPETFDPLAEAEAIRLLVVEVGSRLARLITMLRSTRKEKKVLANVWAGLKQLNLAPGGPS
jgi:hypothetical protein